MAQAVRSPGGASGGLLRIKPVDLILRQADDQEHGLRRSLGTLSLTFLGVAAIIGAGIFVVTGNAAATDAGPGIVLSYAVAGIVSGLAALCYAELASSVPISGSAYTYSYAVLGEFIAWIIGWDLVLEYGVGASAVAAGWSGTLSDFLKAAFNVALPASIANPPFKAPSNPTPGIINLPALLIILVLTALLIFGTRESARTNNIIVAVKLAVILFFIVVGIGHIKTGNWHPYLPFGWSGVFSGASIVFFAFIGFDQISTAAEEAQDPQRTLPRGIIASLLICTVLYIAVSGILTGMVKYTRLDNPSPVSHAMLQVGLSGAATIVSIGALAGLTTVLLVLLFGQSRIFFSMSRDGMLPPLFSRVHPTYRTPYMSHMIVGVLIALIAGFTPISELVKLVNIGTLAAFILVSIAVWRLRYTQPDLERGYRIPAVPVISILTVIGCVVLLSKLPGITFVRFVVWMALGLIVYFLYSRRHSKLEAGVSDLGPTDAPIR